ncbi:hypothetical protein BOSEA31B_20116 [Hyphomicrobiales bacterium]|jgi:hypothetical protein|nr:hypothetical protein BOSEA31B_20116 [Hyphomicrobiales bacterium]CAH1702512.1 hypothetical protein BOSEA1005_30384 [Hyphomicrobiales bacterium]CAI0346713.1 hypothetical protein BO1005MUT1_520225 [Hyphomicrobiales bacterium]
MGAHRIHLILTVLAALHVSGSDSARSQGFLAGNETESEPVIKKQQQAAPRIPKRESYLETQEEADARPEDPPLRQGPIVGKRGPSKEATLSAIKDIYNDRGKCSNKTESHGFLYSSTTTYASDFEFEANESSVSFKFEWSAHIVVAGQPSSKVGGVISSEFNPGDIDIMNSKYENYGNDDYRTTLFLYCSGGDNCVKGARGRGRVARIDFCGMDDLRRVHRALKHLVSFYKPSPRSPF